MTEGWLKMPDLKMADEMARPENDRPHNWNNNFCQMYGTVCAFTVFCPNS